MSTVGEIVRDPNLLRVGAVAAAETAAYAVATVVKMHRAETHQSLRVNRMADLGMRVVLWGFGTHARQWTRVHEVHHSVTDVNLGGVIEVADLLEYMDANPGFEGPPVPESFDTVDPIAVLTPGQVKEVGGLAREHVKDRYRAPDSYSPETAKSILYPKRPHYLYPEGSDLHPLMRLLTGRGKDETQPEPGSLGAISAELRDPHSPLLHPGGAPGVQMRGIALYKTAVDHFRGRESKGELSGGDRLDDAIFNKRKTGMVVGYLGTAALALLAMKDPSVKEALLYGALTYPAIGQLLKASSNAVNAWGHAGDNHWQALKNELVPHADGTVASNAQGGVLNLITADEVGNQASHHIRPWDVAYTSARGLKRFREAPFGSIVQWVAARGVGVHPGDQFGNPNITVTNDGKTGLGDVRPDMPLPAVQLLQSIRAQQLAGRAA